MKAKFNATMVDLFRETFCWLPLAHVLNKRVFVVHGGLFAQDGVTLDDIRKIKRFRWSPPSQSGAYGLRAGVMCVMAQTGLPCSSDGCQFQLRQQDAHGQAAKAFFTGQEAHLSCLG